MSTPESKPQKPTLTLNSHINNLIQHFYIIGVDSPSIFSESLYSTDPIHLLPKVISKYPNIDFPYLSLSDDIVASHCFPNGIDIIEKKQDDKVVNEYFLFSIDNPNPIPAQTDFKYNKIYFSCFLFHERITYYHEYYQMKKGTEIKNATQNKYLPKVICISSFIPLYHDFMKILTSLRNYIIDSPNLVNFYPIEKIIESLVFDLPSPPRGVSKVHFEFLDGQKFVFEQTKPNDIPNPQLDLNIITARFKIEQIFQVLKCVLLEVPILFFCKNKMFLTNIVEGFASLIFPFEYPHSVIAMLPRENYSLIQSISCFLIGINDTYRKDYFETNNIEIGNKIVLIVSIEGKSVEISQYKPKENCPIIKSSKFNYSYPESIFEKFNLPLHYTEKTIKTIKNLILQNALENKNKNLNDSSVSRSSFQSDKDTSEKGNEDKSNKQVFIYNLRSQFFIFFISIMQYYQDYLIPNEKINDMHYASFLKRKLKTNDVFKVKKFIKDIPKLDRDFFKKFLDTRIFYNFLSKKLFPQTIQDKIEILFFDESINKKLNKKLAFQFKRKSTPLLDHAGFKHKIIIIKINLPSFSPEESEIILSNKGISTIVDYYQNISIDNQTKKIKIYYNVFPRLLNSDHFFFNDTEKATLKSITSSTLSSMSEDTKSEFFVVSTNIINSKEVRDNYQSSHYSLSTLNGFEPTSSNKLMQTWLKVVALWFGSFSVAEKENKFSQIKSLLMKDFYIERNIYALLFISMIKHGTIEMAVELFLLMRNKSYTNFLMLRSKMKSEGFISKKEEIGFDKLDTLIDENEVFEEQKVIDGIMFLSKQKCNFCNGEIVYFDSTQQLNFIIKKDKDQCLIQCNYCKKINLVNATVIIYSEKFNQRRKLTFSLMSLTSIYEAQFNQKDFYKKHFSLFWSILWFCSYKFPTKFLISQNENLIISEYQICSKQSEFCILTERKNDTIINNDSLILDDENYDLSSNANNFFEYKTNTNDINKKHFGSKCDIKSNYSLAAFPILKTNSNGTYSDVKFTRHVKKINSVKEGFDMKKRIKRGIHKSLDFDNNLIDDDSANKLSDLQSTCTSLFTFK